jgi:preprotein translocase subunit SecA
LPTVMETLIHHPFARLLRCFFFRPRHFAALHRLADAHGRTYSGMDRQAVAAEVSRLRAVACTRGLSLATVAQAFALIREQAARHLGLRHYAVQLTGGWILLNGMVAEMETGEGKTLTATLPAGTAALAGIPVHIITVNDYLARRDGEWMTPVYRAMGLTVGVVTHDMAPHERRQAYGCDVVYVTNKEVVFDYLKDHLAVPKRPGHIQYPLRRLSGAASGVDRLLLRGLCFGIVDEADSVLIDEAKTPLVISGTVDTGLEEKLYRQTLDVAAQLEMGTDYRVDQAGKRPELTKRGCQRLAERTRGLGGFWAAKKQREHLVGLGLAALHLYRKNKEYIVRKGAIHIVDEYTGRTLPDRSWERGLHQLIECKEGCPISGRHETLAKISYQRFFRRYHTVAGMTGTAREVRRELWQIYGLQVVSVAPNRPLQRKQLPEKFFATSQKKLDGLVARTKAVHGLKRPILIGTASVALSETIAARLSQEGVNHRLLNARQDKAEAEIIALAGRKGQVTVATNMAGRGTDIALGDGVRKLGGLHVIGAEKHSAGRIDRQLMGRCGRQGDPGSFELFLSLEDEILHTAPSSPVGSLLVFLAGRNWPLKAFFGKACMANAQKRIEKQHARLRRQLLRQEEFLINALAFSGSGE